MAGNDVVCGLKLTHDGGLAVVEGNRLVCSIEAEKLENRPRYSAMDTADDIISQLEACGLGNADVASFAIDGWVADDGGLSRIDVVRDGGHIIEVEVAGYEDHGSDVNLLASDARTSTMLGRPISYRSRTHATGHALASYCTSPFAAAGGNALVLVWDGGMAPCLYLFDAGINSLTRICSLFGMIGNVYPIFASNFAPFRIDWRARAAVRGLEFLLPISGKAMAYAAIGEPSEEAIEIMAGVTEEIVPVDSATRCFQWAHRVLGRLRPLGLPDPAVLASFEKYLGRLLLSSLEKVLAGDPRLRELPICLSGGCALNIKWNAAIRRSGLFAGVWVPPFPNDSGSAIGAACGEMITRTGRPALEWSVFSGPPVDAVPAGAALPGGWSSRPCAIEELARILAPNSGPNGGPNGGPDGGSCGEPVIVLGGRAELGPRALGHRSIVAPATDPSMRERLNAMKGREWYRPVAPICLQDHAPEVFAPGTADPFMLFEHHVRDRWRQRVPAIVHVDGSARLQTVGPDNPLMHRLLTSYHRLTGIPVLCNTSANRAGSGFFPDAHSAMEWDRAGHVWSDGTLYSKIRHQPALSSVGTASRRREA